MTNYLPTHDELNNFTYMIFLCYFKWIWNVEGKEFKALESLMLQKPKFWNQFAFI
jgi:hypothetical protein